MTNNELIITDLCAKLQYNLFVQRGGRARKVLAVYPNSNRIVLDNSPYMPQTYSVDEVKPYLRSKSSMTEEEKEEYYKLQDDFICLIPELYKLFDWLDKHRFDYRGLIEKDLAIEAPNDMYNN